MLFKFNALNQPKKHSEGRSVLDNNLILIKTIKELVKDEENLDKLTLVFKAFQLINLDNITDQVELKEASDLLIDIHLSIMYHCLKDEKNLDKLLLAFQVLNRIDIDGNIEENIENNDDLIALKAAKGYRGTIYVGLRDLGIGVREDFMKGNIKHFEDAVMKFIKERETPEVAPVVNSKTLKSKL
jgi:hypothetical protein